MLRKTPYEKPQSAVVHLTAPIVLSGTSGYSSTPGTWSNDFDPFFTPGGFGVPEFPSKIEDLL
jgi:hypothetical protein